MKRILIVDDVHEKLIDGLTKCGFEISYQKDITREKIIAVISEFEGLVVRTKTEIDEELLAHAIKLEFIGRAGSGLDNVDTNYCDKHHVKYFNAGEANADAVGEQTLAMMLSLFSKMVKADDEVRKLIWDREGNRGVELKGKTVAIIGYGNTGKSVARKLSGFGVKVLAYDKYLVDYADEFAIESSMQHIFENADVITFHVPLTPETKHLVNNAYINQFKRNIFLLNLSRGKVVKTDDVISALKSRKIVGIALDVLENENLAGMNETEKNNFEYLRNSSQTILTPHVGGWTSESYEKISEVLLHKINDLYFEQ